MNIDAIDNGGWTVLLSQIFCFDDILHMHLSFPFFADCFYVCNCDFIIRLSMGIIKKPLVTIEKSLDTFSVRGLFSRFLLTFLLHTTAPYQKHNLYHKEHKKERCYIRLASQCKGNFRESM